MTSPSLRVFSGLWGFPFSVACKRLSAAFPLWHLGPSAENGRHVLAKQAEIPALGSNREWWDTCTFTHLCQSGSQLPWLLLSEESNHFWGFESLANGSLNCLKKHIREECTIPQVILRLLTELNKQHCFWMVAVDCHLVDRTSCIPLSSSTSVMSPVMIFFRESLISFSCSNVSFFVSSYSSSSSSSLKIYNGVKSNLHRHAQAFLERTRTSQEV